MTKNETLSKIMDLGLLAVIRGPSEELTLDMVDALVSGGVVGIEITYSTPNAEAVVSRLDEKFGDKIVLGMGTLTRPEQALSAKKAGAKFLVSPICETQLLKALQASGLVFMAGALTPTEVYQAYTLGSDIVKIFPGSLTGPAYIKNLKGPFPEIPMMPTGGVTRENIRDWFAAGAVAVGAGSNLCPAKLAKEGKFAEISEIAADFAACVAQAKESLK